MLTWHIEMLQEIFNRIDKKTFKITLCIKLTPDRNLRLILSIIMNVTTVLLNISKQSLELLSRTACKVDKEKERETNSEGKISPHIHS